MLSSCTENTIEDLREGTDLFVAERSQRSKVVGSISGHHASNFLTLNRKKIVVKFAKNDHNKGLKKIKGTLVPDIHLQLH